MGIAYMIIKNMRATEPKIAAINFIVISLHNYSFLRTFSVEKMKYLRPQLSTQIFLLQLFAVTDSGSFFAHVLVWLELRSIFLIHSTSFLVHAQNNRHNSSFSIPLPTLLDSFTL